MTKKKKAGVDFNKAADHVIGWLAEDHHYEVDVDYERSSCTCYDSDDYCRCTSILGARVKNADPQKMASYAVPDKAHNTLFHYMIERIFVTVELWNEDHWDVEVCGGYYGEEITGVKMVQSTQQLIKKKINELKKGTVLDKMYFILTEEYGYVLDILKKATAVSVETVSIDTIKLGNMEYHTKFKKGACPYYSNEDYHEYNLPIAVCIPDQHKFRLLDGYHRYGTAKAEDRKQVEIVLMHIDQEKGEKVEIFD